MRARGRIWILAAALGFAALLAAEPASAQGVRVVLDAAPSRPTAAGLLVPGRGPTFSRQETLDALEALGRGRCPCRWTFFVTLPRAAGHEYDGLERVWISGPGYPSGSMLVSDRTRVPGLVSVHDLEPTARALEKGEKPPVTARRVSGVDSRLDRLEERLDRTHATRTRTSILVGALVALFALLCLVFRSRFLGRAALLASPLALAAGLALSAAEVSEPWTVTIAVVAIAAVGAPALAAVTADRRALAVALLAVFPVYLIVLSVSTETSSFAAIGARPENGGRFYGLQNQLETMLLVPALLGAALLGRRFVIPVGLLALVTVGASFAGADGGGLVVFAAAFTYLWLRLRDTPLTARNVVLAGAVVVALGLVVVGVDAALGGESHVTRAVEGGPAGLAGDLAHRVRLSAGGVFSSLESALVVPAGLAVLVWLGLRRPRFATVDALLVALAVSLLVNDSPRDVSAWGALSCAALRFWEESRRVE